MVQLEFHQAGQVALGGMKRNAGHGNRLAAGIAAGGKGDVEQAGGLLGIVIEQFVEITHTVEQQLVRVVLLDAEVLLHHGSVGNGFLDAAHEIP